ncbi:E3 ubiquitin-protein ligase MPSR1-like [Neltuma alba]|uniref:E3 ubiquitin-protein ligase MPSR1-like n=1 Tax=Neltuma alba TaxID=207710 RepID=UPI0010A53F9E|nr:E3 ubiquitin-protein ligase MPSR1-like [Prosopis alba]
MSSEPGSSASSSSPTADELDDHQIRRLTLLLPFIFRVAAPRQNHHDNDSILDLPLGVILFNPATRTTVMIDRSLDLDSLIEEVPTKPGLLPASKDSMAAMPTVAVTEEDSECAICLEDYVTGEEAREMPCKHRFHPRCIEKWLGIHGVCPVCRFPMPVDDRDAELHSGETTESDGDLMHAGSNHSRSSAHSDPASDSQIRESQRG